MIYITYDPDYISGLPSSFITKKRIDENSFMPPLRIFEHFIHSTLPNKEKELELEYHKYLDAFPSTQFENLNNTVVILPPRECKIDMYYYQWFLNYLEKNNYQYRRLDKHQTKITDFITKPLNYLTKTITTCS